MVDLDRNFLKCRGEIRASSEALTHAGLYQADPSIRAVVHVHSRPVWERYRDQLPTTREDVAYGTPEMAYEMIRLHRRGAFGARGVVVMGGHRDGVIAFGPTLAGTAQEMLDLTGA